LTLTLRRAQSSRLDVRKEAAMDFIERIFGIAPDAGSGSFELLLFLVPLAGIAYLALRVRARRRRRD
jgi:hypothetical protein